MFGAQEEYAAPAGIFFCALENDARLRPAIFCAQLFLRAVPNYNQIVLKLEPHSRFLLASLSNRSKLSTEEQRQPAVERSRDSIASAAAISLWRTSSDLGRRSLSDCKFCGQSQELSRQFFAGVGGFGAPYAPCFLRICTG